MMDNTFLLEYFARGKLPMKQTKITHSRVTNPEYYKSVSNSEDSLIRSHYPLSQMRANETREKIQQHGLWQ